VLVIGVVAESVEVVVVDKDIDPLQEEIETVPHMVTKEDVRLLEDLAEGFLTERSVMVVVVAVDLEGDAVAVVVEIMTIPAWSEVGDYEEKIVIMEMIVLDRDADRVGIVEDHQEIVHVLVVIDSTVETVLEVVNVGISVVDRGGFSFFDRL